jgi:hypothetical protein
MDRTRPIADSLATRKARQCRYRTSVISLTEGQRLHLGIAFAGLAIVASLAIRYADVMASADTSLVDFRALHGNRLLFFEQSDTRLNAWILSWLFHAALLDPTSLFDANAFHPSPGSLTGSEHLLGIALQMWPARLFTSNAIALH